jgi:hypothetical protein
MQTACGVSFRNSSGAGLARARPPAPCWREAQPAPPIVDPTTTASTVRHGGGRSWRPWQRGRVVRGEQSRGIGGPP